MKWVGERTKRSAYEQKIEWRDEKDWVFGQNELLQLQAELVETRDDRNARVMERETNVK